MKIIADTAALMSPAQGAELGMTIIPVCVSINDELYQDYVQITSAEFLEHIAAGGVPTSSQPAIGDMVDAFNRNEGEILFLTVGDGLSGAYQTALSARSLDQDPQRIHVINSKTLGGPLRYLANKAMTLKEQGLDLEHIKAALHESVESSISFVIPEDFEFLKRSGRLTAITAKVGGALKLLPVLSQSKDKTRISPVGIKRSWKTAVDLILEKLEAANVGARHLISVCHAGTPEKAAGILQQVQERFCNTETEILELSPGLITHGGPGCIVIQAILK